MLRLLLVFFVWCAEKLLCPDPDHVGREPTTIENFSFRIESFDMKAPVETWLQKIKTGVPSDCDLPDLLSYEDVSECPFLDRLESFRGKVFSERERFGAGGASTETSSFAFLGGGGFYYVSKPYQGALCWPHGYIYILKDLVDESRAPLNSERSNFDGVLLVLKEDVCVVQSVTVLNSPLKINSLFDQSKAGNVFNIEDFRSWCISHGLGEEGLPPRDF